MKKVQPGRFTAEVDQDIVVFMIGMRMNRPWKVGQWLPVARAMPTMLRWLAEHPQEGLLHAEGAWMMGGPTVVQYWRTVEDTGDTGIWHETYAVRADAIESVYGNMPVVGLAKATHHVPVGRKGQSAARRMGLTETDEVAVPGY